MRTGKQGGNLDDTNRAVRKETERVKKVKLDGHDSAGELRALEDLEKSRDLDGTEDLDRPRDLEDLESAESLDALEDLGETEGLDADEEFEDLEEFEELEELEELDFDPDEDSQEEWYGDEGWNEEEPVKAWKTLLVFLGLMAAAAIICAALWHFSHTDKPEDGQTGNQGQIPSASEPESVASGDSTDPSASDSASQGTDEMQNGEEDEIAAVEPVDGTKDMEFTAVEQSVTPKDVVNLRSVPTTLDTENIVTQVQNGEVLLRTGINEDTGWSEIEYQGEKLYAVSQFLTLDLNYKPSMEVSNPNRVSTIDGRIIIFADCDDWVTPKEYVNLRTEPSTSEGNETVSCQLNYGEKAHRTGFSPDSGWSRVEYNGQVLYVVTSLISTTEE